MRKVLFLILLLILSTISLSDPDPIKSQTLLLEFTIDSYMDLIPEEKSYTLETIDITLNYNPQDSYRQKIVTLDTTPQAIIDGNIKYHWDNPKTTQLEFSLKTQVETSAEFYKITSKAYYPIKNIPGEVYKYTKASPMIDINDDIREVAATLAQGETDLYIVLFKLAKWVKQNIEYDLTSIAAEAVEPSSWVLENREGVCDEMTNLFISLARSLGIPARFVTGYSFTNSEEFLVPWGAHGWAEVYFHGYGWVPFDPTYGQLGYIDAGHIKLKDSVDSNRSSTEYEWLGKNIDIQPYELEMNVKILSYGKSIEPMTDISIQAYDNKVGFGSYNYIEATIENTNNYYVTEKLYLSTPENLELISDVEQSVVLAPYEQKSLYWILKTPSDLEKRYIYTFPAILQSQRDQHIDTEFIAEYGETDVSLDFVMDKIEQIDKETNDKVLFYCSSDKQEVGLDEEFDVQCTLKNNVKQTFSNIKVCMENDCVTTDLYIDEVKSLYFKKSFDSIGSKVIPLTARNKDISKSYYYNVMVLDLPQVEIKDFNYPENVKFKDEFVVNFTIEKISYSIPQNAKLSFYQNKNKNVWPIENLDAALPFNILISGETLKEGSNDIKIFLEFEDDKGSVYSEEKTVVINMETETLLEKLMVYLNQAALFLERLIMKEK